MLYNQCNSLLGGRDMAKVGNRSKTEMIRCNRTAMICHFIEISILFAAYMLEVVKGERAFMYLCSCIN